MLLAVLAGPAQGAVFYLRADVTTLTLPGGEKVGMWGFARDSSFGAGDGTVTIPGPLLTVAPGDPTLTIRLQNRLTAARTGIPGGQPVSLIIPALPAKLLPVTWATGTPYAGRVRSLNTETPPGNSAAVEYTWTGVKPGTYLYHSATQIQVQVQMGLYGGLVKDADTRAAYPGVPYDQDEVLVYSEIDPELHRAVVRGEYGPGKRVTSTIDYHPRWFLVNGRPSTKQTALHLNIVKGRRTLLRLLNAGLESHVPMLQGETYRVVAEDGNPYRWPNRQYAPLLAAGKTLDALVIPGMNGTLPIFDHMLNLTNSDGVTPGGMLSTLEVGNATGSAPVARNDAYSVNEDRTLTVSGAGVLANDFNPAGSQPLVALLVSGPRNGTLALTAGGAFTYTPKLNFNGTDRFSYQVSNAMFDSGVATVTLTVNPVNDPPVALNRHYTVPLTGTLAVPAPGVLLGASDPEGQPLTAVKTSDPSRGTLTLNANGSFNYRPSGTTTGNVSFSYRASDGSAQSAPATVTIKLAAQDGAPVAVNDAWVVKANTPLTVAAPGVLANDSDPDGDTLMARSPSAPAKGTVTLRPEGGFTYTPNAGATGKDTFSYQASDGLKSTAAMVTVTINP